jgi:L-2-hydroxyglutarate oxidase LhgO
MTQRYYDICVVGGGILGSFVAKNCAKRWPGASVGLLESEQNLHNHNSSRNSGVLHSGLYYTPGTLKARMSVAGTKAMKAYCDEHQIPIRNCGKLVVPTTEDQQ